MTIHPQLTETIPGHYENDEYVFFWSGVFSNWYTSPFNYDTCTPEYGVQMFTSAEQAMMFCKAYTFNDHDSILKIMATNSPRSQKALGRLVKNFDKCIWENVNIDLITNILVSKFKSGPILQQILIATGAKKIVEASPYDKIYGIGMGVGHENILTESKWLGTNHLGVCLMNARSIIKAELDIT